ncbi:hypothetical protein [Ferruginibacter sp. SUN106]|uniref:hypothetical protein n=1 Tax=Ferruginibacter sp. SUN106 TaxID=2978348 RepID=UPI003D36C437
MKKIILSVICLVAVGLVNAQSSFGVISYTLPEGWIARPVGSDMELVKSGEENSGCSITFFKQMNTIVTAEKRFGLLWASKTKSGNNNLQKFTIPVRTEGDGWVCIAASKTIPNGTSADTEGFYTLCDSSITAIILIQSPGNSCLKEIQNIMASINIPVKDSNPKLRAKTKKTKFPYVYR